MRAERDRRAAILTAEGFKQSQILTAEGEKQAAILRAEGGAQAAILTAEGEARAILQVFDAVHRGDADPKLLAYQYLQTLPKIAASPSNKMWFLPSELTSALGTFAKGFGGPVTGRRRRAGLGPARRHVAAGRRPAADHADGPGRGARRGAARVGGGDRGRDELGHAQRAAVRPVRRAGPAARRGSGAAAGAGAAAGGRTDRLTAQGRTPTRDPALSPCSLTANTRCRSECSLSYSRAHGDHRRPAARPGHAAAARRAPRRDPARRPTRAAGARRRRHLPRAGRGRRRRGGHAVPGVHRQGDARPRGRARRGRPGGRRSPSSRRSTGRCRCASAWSSLMAQGLGARGRVDAVDGPAARGQPARAGRADRGAPRGGHADVGAPAAGRHRGRDRDASPWLLEPDADRLRLPARRRDRAAHHRAAWAPPCGPSTRGAAGSTPAPPDPERLVDLVLHGVLAPTRPRGAADAGHAAQGAPQALPGRRRRRGRAAAGADDRDAVPAQPQRADHRRRRGAGRHRGDHAARRRDARASASCRCSPRSSPSTSARGPRWRSGATCASGCSGTCRRSPRRRSPSSVRRR